MCTIMVILLSKFPTVCRSNNVAVYTHYDDEGDEFHRTEVNIYIACLWLFKSSLPSKASLSLSLCVSQFIGVL